MRISLSRAGAGAIPPPPNVVGTTLGADTSPRIAVVIDEDVERAVNLIYEAYDERDCRSLERSLDARNDRRWFNFVSIKQKYIYFGEIIAPAREKGVSLSRRAYLAAAVSLR